MNGFITVGSNPDKALILPDNITLVTESNPTDPQHKDDKHINIASTLSPQMMLLSEQAWGISAQEICDSLAAAGKPLIQIPFVWAEKTVGRHFVNPSALSYITASTASEDKGSEATAAILIGLKGGGYVETHAVPKSILQDFVDAARAANPNLHTITPDTASSRFYSPGFTAYDPADIVRIYPNGGQVNLLYRDGFCSDFNMPRRDKDNNAYLDKLYNRIVRMKGLKKDDDTLLQDPSFVRSLREHAQNHIDRKESSIRAAFSRAVAADCPHLYEFETAAQPFYTTLNNLKSLRVQDEYLHADYLKDKPEGRGIHAAGHWINFRNNNEARAAFAAFQQRIPTKEL